MEGEGRRLTDGADLGAKEEGEGTGLGRGFPGPVARASRGGNLGPRELGRGGEKKSRPRERDVLGLGPG